jgi:DNA primase
VALQPLSKSQKKSLLQAAENYAKQMNPDVLAYLEERGLDAETVRKARLGCVSTPIAGHEWLQGRLAIPYLGPRGNVYNLRFRCLAHADCKSEGCDAKYLSLPGYPSRVYNVRAVRGTHSVLHVTEGELDCVTLGSVGLAAIGIPGVENLPAHFPRLVAGFTQVFLWADADKAGRELIKAFTKAVPHAEAVWLPEGQDVNSLYVQGGREALLDLLPRQVVATADNV